MKISDYIAIVAVIIAVVSGVFSIKSDSKATRLQSEMLELSKSSQEFEIRKGELQLIQLLSRYFVVQLNCWELNGKMKTDSASVEKYICELKLINDDARKISNNPFYYEIASKYPEIDLLWISLRGLIIDKETDMKMSLDPNTFYRFCDLFDEVKGEVKSDRFFSSQYHTTIEEAIAFLKSEVPKLKVQKK